MLQSALRPVVAGRLVMLSLLTCCVLMSSLIAITLRTSWGFAPLLGAALLYGIFRWPVAVIGVILFVAPFLPLPLLSLKLYGTQGVQALSASKEVGLLAAALVLGRRQRLSLQTMDWVMLALIVWATSLSMMLSIPSMWIGLKDDFGFVISYLVGRAISLDRLWVKVGLWIAGIVAALALLEFFVLGIGPRILLMNLRDPVELTSFKADFFGGFRASSTLGGPLEFGGFCAIVLLIFASFYRQLPKKYWLLGALVFLGLLSSATRMAALGLVLGCMYIAVRTNEKLRFAALLFVFAISVAGVMLPLMGLEGFLKATLSGEDSSLSSHSLSIREKSAYVLTHPLGSGAGTVGPRAAARDPNSLEVESGYLLFGMEYGWLGFFLFLAFCGWMLFHLARDESNFGVAACSVLIAMLTMLTFTPIHMEFGLNSWAWVIIGSGLRPRSLTTT